MTHFYIVHETMALDAACPLCGEVVHVEPGAVMTLGGEMYVCDDCARQGDHDLWRVLMWWRSSRLCAAVNRWDELHGVRAHDEDDDFDTDFWREALA